MYRDSPTASVRIFELEVEYCIPSVRVARNNSIRLGNQLNIHINNTLDSGKQDLHMPQR
jgi:hypothetical protein